MAKKAAPASASAPKAAEPKAAAPAAEKSAGKAATKGEVYTKLAAKSGLTKKQISSVFEALTDLISGELGKKGPGVFQLPGLLKLKVVHKPATKAKQGINPFTKEVMTYKAKPARKVVKALPLKYLKELV
jgi:nucleoid DNA-binding protein